MPDWLLWVLGVISIVFIVAGITLDRRKKNWEAQITKNVTMEREQKEMYTSLARQLANTVNFSLDQSKENELEAQLLAGGDIAMQAIEKFLTGRCATGVEDPGWWHSAERLVKLIARYYGKQAESHLKHLIWTPSQIWEYQTQVKNVAQRELDALAPQPAKPVAPSCDDASSGKSAQ